MPIIEFSALIHWINPFQILEFWVVIYNLIQILKVHSVIANSAEHDQMPPSAPSDLVLHCLLMMVGLYGLILLYMHI